MHHSQQGPYTVVGNEIKPDTNSDSTHRLLTLNTDQRPIEVPVDAGVALGKADEKRHNESGSAKSGERECEKERETA